MPKTPITPKRPVQDLYHGMQVQDDYRWLEDATDPQVRAWMNAQNDRTRAILDASPALPKLTERLKELSLKESSRRVMIRYRGGKLFALKVQPPKQQPLLVTFPSTADLLTEQVVFDPNELDPSGATTIDWYVPSLDGQFVAVCVSKSGSELGTAYVYEVSTGKRLANEVPRVQAPTAGGSIAWNANNDGFYYTRYPRVGERPDPDLHFFQQVFYHRLGTPHAEDTYAIGQEFPRIAEVSLSTSMDGRYVVATVANGDGGEFAHHVRGPDDKWTQLSNFKDQLSKVSLGRDGFLYLLDHKGFPRGQIVRVPLAHPELSRVEVVVPQGENAIDYFAVSNTRLYVIEMLGGPSQLRCIDLETGTSELIDPEPVSSIFVVVPVEDDDALFFHTSYLTPPAWYRYRPGMAAPQRTPLFMTSPADFSDCEVVREFACSRDGTQVPISIIRRKDTSLDGNNPTLLYGYGGYSICESPWFNSNTRIWLDAGGVYAVANLRGGGEFGEDWHKAGMLTNKQNVFDDFAACAQHLIGRGYTNSSRLAIEGGSNGGLLVGAALTQNPNLFRAVVGHVGIYDMLRVELDPNGAFNVTEFGTVTNPSHFKALYDYSPFQRVVDATHYPAVLLLTGENDGRVNPMHSRKMAARLQAVGSPHPTLLRISTTSGHGQGTARDERIQIDADVFAFLFAQMGLGL